MKLSILTMVTKPDERQDKWREAVANYSALADEVIVVNGGPALEYNDPKVKIVDLAWPDDWSYEELPRHLNYGKNFCTGDWILKLDIDQLVHESNFGKLRKFLSNVPENINLVKLNKINFVAKMMFYSKGSQGIVFRNHSDIWFGLIEDFPQGDLCIPMKVTSGIADVVPRGVSLKTVDSGCAYWNFSYTFRTQEIAKQHYARIGRAYRKYFDNKMFGSNDDEAWSSFIRDLKMKWSKAIHKATPEDIPVHIREAVVNLKPEEKGFNLWGMIK